MEGMYRSQLPIDWPPKRDTDCRAATPQYESECSAHFDLQSPRTPEQAITTVEASQFYRALWVIQAWGCFKASPCICWARQLSNEFRSQQPNSQLKNETSINVRTAEHCMAVWSACGHGKARIFRQ